MQPRKTDGLRVRPTALPATKRGAWVSRKSTDPLPSDADTVLAKDRVAELKSKYRPDELRAVRFEDFFEGGALGWAEDYAVPTGVVDECRKRGLEGLL